MPIVSPNVIKALLVNPDYAVNFSLERLSESATQGRASVDWTAVGTVTGVLTRASEADLNEYGRRDEAITHTLALPYDALVVRPNDRLAQGGHFYWVRDVVNPSALGLYTRLLVEERPT